MELKVYIGFKNGSDFVDIRIVYPHGIEKSKTYGRDMLPPVLLGIIGDGKHKTSIYSEEASKVVSL